jgi:glycosyltransferase involved in cell wall biosynthesis
MRVALVSEWAPPRLGGLEQQIDGLARQLRARGHEVRVITLTPGPPELDGIPVHRLRAPVPPGWRSMQRGLERVGVPWFDPLPRVVTDELARLLVVHRVEVVHAHAFASVLAYMSLKLASDLGIASVFTNHSLFERAGILFMRGIGKVGPWHSWPTVITAVSARAARDAALTTDRQVRVVPNGLDTAAWAREAAPFADTPRETRARRRVVSVMRLNARKSPGTLVEAFATLRARLDGGMPRLDVYGDGPLLQSVRGRSRDLRLDEVRFHGARPTSEIAAALAAADVFALPGSRESFGIAVAEAFAAGVPAVTMRASATTDIFSPGAAGLVADDAADFARQIERLVTDDALRCRLAAAAPAQAAPYDWRHVTPLYLDAYRDALRAT